MSKTRKAEVQPQPVAQQAPTEQPSARSFYRIERLTPLYWRLIEVKDGVETVLDKENIHAVVMAKFKKLVLKQPCIGSKA
jgi:hypothetical protein